MSCVDRLDTRWLILVACTLAFFVTMVARLAVSPVVPAISDTYHLSTGAIGLALSGMWLAYALSQFPSGLLGDRFGERSIILVALCCTAVMSSLLALAPTYLLFVAGAFLLGAGAGLHYSVATTLLTRTFDRTGSAIGIHSAGAPIAGLVTPIVAGYIGVRFGWRPAVALGTAVAVPALVVFYVLVPRTDPTTPDTAIRSRLAVGPLFELLSRRPIALTAALSVGGAFVWQATASFLPTFLVEYHGYSEVTAGAIFSVYFIVQGIGQPIIGSLSDRIGRYPAGAIATVAGVGGYGLFVLGEGLAILGVATALVGVAMCWGAALLPKIMDHLTETEQGIGFGLIRTAYMVLGASGSVITGVVVDVFGWGTAFLGLGGVLGAMSIVLLGTVGLPPWLSPVHTPDCGDR